MVVLDQRVQRRPLLRSQVAVEPELERLGDNPAVGQLQRGTRPLDDLSGLAEQTARYLQPTAAARSGFRSLAGQVVLRREQPVIGRQVQLDPLRFALGGEDETTAVTEICRRLDGIALAIELAAARMVSMSPQDVRDRLGDRFRLLSGSRRGLERHQTLRYAVQWSYDLLKDDERMVLCHCSAFADGFDLAAATHICGLDNYTALDLLDSLVRKSLITAEQKGGHARYGMLETIRQFAEDQLAPTGTIIDVRDRHAQYFVEQVITNWALWEGPDQRVALDWVDAEFSNLRAGFRWATDQGHLATAATIAAHTTLLAFPLQRFEPAGWADEILEAARLADLSQLPRLYTAASFCVFTGAPERAVDYARAAVALEADPGYEPFKTSWSSILEAVAHRYAGRPDRWLEIYTSLTAQPGVAHVAGLCGKLHALTAVGRAEEARDIADETVSAARGHGNPFWIAYALLGCGLAFTETEPARASIAFRQALLYVRKHRLTFWEALIARDAALLEAVHGDLEQALTLFDTTLDSFHSAGNVANVALTLASLAVLFERVERPETAATIYGASTHQPLMIVVHLPGVLDRLRAVLGQPVFDECVAAGSAMEPAEAVQYARHQIEHARHELRTGGPQPSVAQ